jgi:tripartite-type tricarboxylate transporter receptor subunit TctC
MVGIMPEKVELPFGYLRDQEFTMLAATDLGARCSPTAVEYVTKHSRRQLLRLALALTFTPAQLAFAVDYPARPVRLVVPFAPGGSTDIIGRLIAQWLSERLGQQFVIENRPGGGTTIATAAVVNAVPDGYTLLLASTAGAIGATLYENLSYNFIHDIAPVAGIIRVPMVMEVNSSFPAKTLPEFVSYAKANPGKINMASSGNGASPHVAGELFKMMTGINVVHVPYRGATPAIADLIGGQVHVFFDAITSSIEFIRAGKLRPLAVTGATRSGALPDIPAIGEFVRGYEAYSWFGVGAPRGTPTEIIDELNREINVALSDPKMLARFADMGASVLPGTPRDFGKFIVDETEKWGKVVKFSGAKPD